MTKPARKDPARGLVRVIDGTVWVKVDDGPSITAWSSDGWEPLVGIERSPREPSLDAKDIRAAIRYAVERQRKGRG